MDHNSRNPCTGTESDSGIEGCSLIDGIDIGDGTNIPTNRSSATTSNAIDSLVNAETGSQHSYDGNTSIIDHSDPPIALHATDYLDEDNNNLFSRSNELIKRRMSSDSDSTFEIIDVPSSISSTSLSDHKSKNPVNILSISAKHSFENNDIDERDRFSPVDLNQPVMDTDIAGTETVPSPPNLSSDSTEISASMHRKPIRLSSKEEKQRQNEEIVVMKSSSGDTSSWDNIFPNHRPDHNDQCGLFVRMERGVGDFCDQSQVIGNGASTESDLEGNVIKSDLPVDPESICVRKQVATSSACFIDASSLLDDTELLYSNTMVLPPKLPETDCLGPKPSNVETLTDHSDDSDKDGWLKDKHLKQLESFHQEFELCKVRGDKKSLESSTNDPNSPTQNLSDEQKLLNLEIEPIQKIDYDIKDQYSSSDSDQMFKMSMTQSDLQRVPCQLDEDESRQRQDHERKQGNMVFQNSIQQFSGHLIDTQTYDPDQAFSSVNSSGLGFDGEVSSMDYSANILDKQRLSDAKPFDLTSDLGSIGSRNSIAQSEVGSVDGLYPDTPHNSILNVNQPEQWHERGIRIPSKRSIDAAPIISGGASITDFTPKQCESPSIRRRTDACPILSGGLDPNDHSDTELSPAIVRPKSLDRMKILQSSWIVDMSDCSSIDSKRRTSNSSSSSDNTTARSIHTPPPTIERTSSGSSHKSGMGFYVSLNDCKPPRIGDDLEKTLFTKKILHLMEPKLNRSAGFYVDLSENEASRTSTPPVSVVGSLQQQHQQQCFDQTNGSQPLSLQSLQSISGESDSIDKKNLFSMFIDFDENKSMSKKDPPAHFLSRLSSSPGRNSRGSTTESSGIDSSNETKPIDIRKLKDKSVIMRSHSTTSNGIRSDPKRHSWNMVKDVTANTDKVSGEYRRSVSLSTDKGIMNILDKLPYITKTSSMSIDSPRSPLDDFTCSKSELSTYSNNSNSLTSNSIHSSVEGRIGFTGNGTAICTIAEPNQKDTVMMTSSVLRKRRRDCKINETFDKSSQGSLTDGIFSGSSSDSDDLTFQNEQTIEITQMAMPKNGVMETIVETKEHASPKKQPVVVVHCEIEKVVVKEEKVPVLDLIENDRPVDMPAHHTMETLQATIEKQKLLLETVNEEVQLSTFVKLSDMDKPSPKFELHNTETMSKSAGSNRVGRLFVDSIGRTNHRNTWHSMSRSTGYNLTNLASSVENLRSLSRLFPHLSSSLPADIEVDLENVIQQPKDLVEYTQSDLSCASSITSSISRSGMDSADESSMSARQPRRLGEDLLKMFLQEVATDVVIEVSGRRMRAHKCILRSRCQYFAAILAGGWVESAGNVISLSGYSFASVHFALCHIYSGAAYPPDGISLMELAALADLLGLEGLKEVTTHALRVNYCHNFHKPCSGCIDGILQVFPVTMNHGLDDLYRKCLRWICKNYMKVWPTRTFSQMPPDMISRCKQHMIAHLNSESVLNVIVESDHLLTLLAPSRWAIGVENAVRDIVDAAHNYISDHFASFIASDGFLSLGHFHSWNILRLENLLLRISSTLTPEQACRSYQRVTRLNSMLGAKVIKVSTSGNLGQTEPIIDSCVDQEEDMDWNPEFVRLVGSILSAVEQCLTRQCSRAMRNNQWQRMDIELRKKIQKLACLSDPIDIRRSRSTTKTLTYNNYISSNNRNHDLYQVKLAIEAHSKRALAHDSQLYRASAHTQTNGYDRHSAHTTYDKSVQANHEPRSTERDPNRILKTTSRAHVPDLIPKSFDKPKINKDTVIKQNGHRRSQSESLVPKKAITKTKTVPQTKQNPVLKDVRSRYLQPVSRQQSKPAASNVQELRTKRMISSSDSSTRTSSPAMRSAPLRKPANGSNTMSHDSLSSPGKHNQRAIIKIQRDCLENENEKDYSIDSLADSLKSSVKTDKTRSQESLIKILKTKSNETKLKSPFSRSNPAVNKVDKLKASQSTVGRSSAATNNRTTQRSLSIGTPSTVTSKSSRLSSITSTHSSPRDSYRGRLLQPIDGNKKVTVTQVQPRKSFLSAKSKEILAKKNALNQSESAKSIPAIVGTVKNAPIPVNKSRSTSMIGGKKPTIIPIKIDKKPIPKNTLMCPTKSSSPKPKRSKTVGNKNPSTTVRLIAEKKWVQKTPKPKRIDSFHQSSSDEIETENSIINRPKRYESKLERSSTFSKEMSDIPTTEIEIID